MSGRYVLAIEHDWRIRKLIRANLEVLGLEVREAVSGQHGLELLAAGLPDLILLNLDLPDMDAWQLLGALRSRVQRRNVAIIVLAEEPPRRQWAEAQEWASYLQKPFAVSALLQGVHRALGDVLFEDRA